MHQPLSNSYVSCTLVTFLLLLLFSEKLVKLNIVLNAIFTRLKVDHFILLSYVQMCTDWLQ